MHSSIGSVKGVAKQYVGELLSRVNFDETSPKLNYY